MHSVFKPFFIFSPLFLSFSLNCYLLPFYSRMYNMLSSLFPIQRENDFNFFLVKFAFHTIEAFRSDWISVVLLLLLCTQCDCHKQSTKWKIEGVNCSKDAAAADGNTQQCKRKTHTDFWLTCFVSKNQSETEPHNSYSAETAQWRAQEELLALHSVFVYEYMGECIKYTYVCAAECACACECWYSYYSCCCRCCCSFYVFKRTHTKK